MKLETLREADYVLSVCGRPTPPPGHRFVDLPRVIPFHFDISAGTPATPFNRSIANTSPTLFLCRGVSISAQWAMRVKWPSGRFLSQQFLQASDGAAPEITPNGGGAMFAFNKEVGINADGRITIQIAPPPFGGGSSVDAFFWGVLRYLLNVKGDGAGVVETIPDPVQELERRPRLVCGPNQNIMAPEFLLGNQCTPETPDGFQDEPYTFFSPAIVIPFEGEVFNVAVIVPGSDDFILRKLRFRVTFTAPLVSAVPVLQIRLPNGYSLTGGDYIPVLADGSVSPYCSELPVFPTLRIPVGQRIILDAADMVAVGGGGSSTLTVEFDGVKRRRQGAQ